MNTIFERLVARARTALQDVPEESLPLQAAMVTALREYLEDPDNSWYIVLDDSVIANLHEALKGVLVDNGRPTKRRQRVSIVGAEAVLFALRGRLEEVS